MSTGNTVRTSKWTHQFQGKGNGFFALYHSLGMDVVFLEDRYQDVVRFLQLGTTEDHLGEKNPDLSGELPAVLAELARTGMIVAVDANDDLVIEEKRAKYVLPPGLETLYLLVTDDCNLRCSYCFINNNMPVGYKHSVMTFEAAREAIDMFFANLLRNPPEYAKLTKTIFFYGGEPLLNFGLIRQIIEYIDTAHKSEVDAMGEKFRLSIVSNGTLMDEEMAAFIASRSNLDIAISIDGVAEVHDSQRHCANGCGSFSGAIRSCELLRAAGKADVSVSCTVGEHNIDRLPELLELNRKYGFASINLNPLTDTAAAPVSEEYMQAVSQRMIEYFQLARVDGVYEDRMMRKAKSFMEKRIHAYDCQALGAQLVCSPDGQLGICHEGVGLKQFFFGRVSREFDFHTNPVIAEWKRRTPLNMPQCYGCPALGICGGGCAYASWLRNGSIWSVDDRFCIHALSSLEWLIWDLFDRL